TWAVLMGLSGGVLLLAGGEGALTVLQVSSLAGAAPLSIVYALGMFALWRVFRYEIAVMPRYVRISSSQGLTGEGESAGSVEQSAPAREAAREAQPGAGSTVDQRNLREVIRAHETPEGAGGLRGLSVSLAGLAPRTGTTGTGPSARSDAPVPAIHDLAPDSVTVDPDDGTLQADDDAAPHDPPGGETADSPECTNSAARNPRAEQGSLGAAGRCAPARGCAPGARASRLCAERVGRTAAGRGTDAGGRKGPAPRKVRTPQSRVVVNGNPG